jgi:AmmeMemoRadiSam system protein A
MFRLNESDQQLLLKIARDSVGLYLDGQLPRVPRVSCGLLAEPHSVFVSIHKGADLRGCIGNIHPVGSLLQTTSECAVSAAVGDPRFMPVTKEELPYLTFEISVLSPMEKIVDVDSIEIGEHGLLINRGNARGLLLPQVATAYGWTRERFLTETCRKAGLPPQAWKDGATIFRFSAHVFGENPIHHNATS